MKDIIYTYYGAKYETYNYLTRLNKATKALNSEDKNEKIKIGRWLETNFKYDHTSYIEGYISRKCKGEIHYYKGRFGKGIAIIHPCYHSTRYCLIDYYIEK